MFKPTEPVNQMTQENLNKYKSAGVIASKVLDKLVKSAVKGEKLVKLCTLGDQLILEECNKVYSEVKYKGIAHPTCISLNNVAGNYISNNNDEVIKEGDLVKIELGVHIDGYPAFVAYTVYVENPFEKISDNKSNVLKAVIEASREIYDVFRPDKTNFDVIKILEKYAKKYNCSLPICNDRGIIPGDISFQISRYVDNGYNNDEDEFIHSLILARENPNYGFTLRETFFEENEVYAMDILMTTGSGRLSIKDINETTIYKRNHNNREQLKLKSSRTVLNLFNNDVFPKNIKLTDPKIKMGLKECIEKDLIESYPVVYEKDNEFIARIKFTVIVKDRPTLICGRPADEQLAKLK